MMGFCLFIFFFLADFIFELGIKRSLVRVAAPHLVISDFLEEAGSAGSIELVQTIAASATVSMRRSVSLGNQGWSQQ